MVLIEAMRLAVVSHKICWAANDSPSGYATDGGFPMQMQAISELFSETCLIVPCKKRQNENGIVSVTGNNLQIRPLSLPKGQDFRRKLAMFGWLLTNGRIIWREIKRADAVHAPIPGDIGTIGMLFALLQRKPLFVRYCGNWAVQRTTAERVWRWSMEHLAGGRNVMLATGGAENPPSARNRNIKWIFSTSLSAEELTAGKSRRRKNSDAPKLIIVCRQEKGKGTDIVLESLPLILKEFPQATLDIVGDGSFLPQLKEIARRLGVEKRVIFHGKVSPKNVLELLKLADLFCFPTASEGFPKVILEALANGLPVVTTPVSVLPQLIGKTQSGRILATTTAKSLAEAVIEIYGDENLYNRMSENAALTVKNYSLEKWRDLIGENLRQAWNVQSLSE